MKAPSAKYDSRISTVDTEAETFQNGCSLLKVVRSEEYDRASDILLEADAPDSTFSLINECDEEGTTVLMYAARADHLLVRNLIRRGAVINVSDNGGMTALHHAILHNPDFMVARALVELGEEVNVIAGKDGQGLTPLQIAVIQADAAKVEVLIDGGANVDLSAPGQESPRATLARKRASETSPEVQHSLERIEDLFHEPVRRRQRALAEAADVGHKPRRPQM